MNNVLKFKVLNALLFQGVFKWIAAVLIFLFLLIGSPEVQENMSKPTIYSYPAANCEVVGENMECHQ